MAYLIQFKINRVKTGRAHNSRHSFSTWNVIERMRRKIYFFNICFIILVYDGMEWHGGYGSQYKLQYSQYNDCLILFKHFRHQLIRRCEKIRIEDGYYRYSDYHEPIKNGSIPATATLQTTEALKDLKFLIKTKSLPILKCSCKQN